MTITASGISVELRRQEDLDTRHRLGQGSLLGTTDARTLEMVGRGIRATIVDIAIARGLPSTLFRGIAVHELGHAWVSLNGVKLSRTHEEGFCGLLAFRFFKHLSTRESGFYARCIERSVDEVYGEGFRMVATLEKEIGFKQLISELLAQKRYPSL